MNACGCHDPAVFGHRCARYRPRPAPKSDTTDRELIRDGVLAARIRWLAAAHG